MQGTWPVSLLRKEFFSLRNRKSALRGLAFYYGSEGCHKQARWVWDCEPAEFDDCNELLNYSAGNRTSELQRSFDFNRS